MEILKKASKGLFQCGSSSLNYLFTVCMTQLRGKKQWRLWFSMLRSPRSCRGARRQAKGEIRGVPPDLCAERKAAGQAEKNFYLQCQCSTLTLSLISFFVDSPKAPFVPSGRTPCFHSQDNGQRRVASQLRTKLINDGWIWNSLLPVESHTLAK